MYGNLKIVAGTLVATTAIVTLATSALVAFNGPYKRVTDTAQFRRGLLQQVLASNQDEMQLRLNAYTRRSDELHRLLDPDSALVRATTVNAPPPTAAVSPPNEPAVGGPFAALEEPANKDEAEPDPPQRKRIVRPAAKKAKPAKPIARNPVRPIRIRNTAARATTSSGGQNYGSSSSNTGFSGLDRGLGQ